MHLRLSLLSLVLLFGTGVPALAQFKEDPEEDAGAKLGQAQTQKWRCGIIIVASGGACRNIEGYAPVPVDWPEQQVKIAEEDVSPGVKINYRTVDGTPVKVMNVKIPYVEAGKEAKALVTFEVRRSVQLAPEKIEIYRLPDVNKLDRTVRPYLAPSPRIETINPKIKELAKKVGRDKENAWRHVEAIYDFVRENVEYKPLPHKGAVGALKEKAGDCEDMTSLFVAICRAANIPARTVWIPGHVYPEFYLLDDKGHGHWFPCQVAGTRAFGEMPDTKPILAKGDNFKLPYRKPREPPVRYPIEVFKGVPEREGGTPQHKFVRELVN